MSKYIRIYVLKDRQKLSYTRRAETYAAEIQAAWSGGYMVDRVEAAPECRKDSVRQER